MKRRLNVYTKGQKITLGPSIAKGGEGEIFAVLDHPQILAKIYHEGMAESRERKVNELLDEKYQELSTFSAKPISALHDARGAFLGFLMPNHTDSHPIFELFSPGSRRLQFPKANYKFLVRVAANLSRAVAAVHATGAAIGDINSNGLLVKSDARLVLIDVDSFQLSRSDPMLRCTVGVPEYTPPRLQGVNFREMARTEDDDLFGLAVMLFQLLFLGRHPFSGSYIHGEKTIPVSIAESRYVYSIKGASEMLRPRGMELVDLAPSYLREAFESAFLAQSNDSRPSAVSWVETLLRLEKSLVPCRSIRSHYFFDADKICPWCKLADDGYEVFPLAPEDVHIQLNALAGATEAKRLTQLWRELERHPSDALLDHVPNTITARPDPSIQARRAKPTKIWSKLKSIASAAAACAIFVFLTPFWFIGVGLVLYAWASWSGETPSYTQFSTNFQQAQDNYLAEVYRWRQSIGLVRLVHLKTELLKAKQQIEQADQELTEKLARLEEQRLESARDNFLSSYLLRKSGISKLSSSDFVALESEGIVTAADISKSKVLRVSGIGPVKAEALTNWRRSMEKKYRPNPSTASADAHAIAREKLAHASQIAGLVSGTADKGKEFLALLSQARERSSKLTPGLLAARHAIDQAKADLTFLGVAIPIAKVPDRLRPTIPPSRPRSNGTSTKTRSRKSSARKSKPSSTPPRPSCPSCGSNMVKRTARKGRYAGSQFWGCSRYPRCRGLLNI